MSTISLRDRVKILFGATPQSLEEAKLQVQAMNTHRMKMLVARTSVQSLFSKSFFSICSVDSLMKLNNVTLCEETREIYDILRALHCVDYGQMPRELVNSLPAAVMSLIYPEMSTEKEVFTSSALRLVSLK